MRNYQVSEIVDVFGDGNGHLVQGGIELLRTNRSILAKGILTTEVELTCSRCLSLFRYPLSLNIEEEYIPTIDIVSGVPLPMPEEPGSFTIDEHHIIDFTEAIRQYTVMSIPMKPLCREECAGLCPNCGRNLNHGPCSCPQPEVDPRWSGLIELLK
jgi:uncharacterized protein